MSRTYRLKKRESLGWDPTWYASYRKIPVIKYLHRCFGDRRAGYRGPTAEFRQYHNRLTRRALERELYQAVANDREALYPRVRRTARYDWL